MDENTLRNEIKTLGDDLKMIAKLLGYAIDYLKKSYTHLNNWKVAYKEGNIDEANSWIITLPSALQQVSEKVVVSQRIALKDEKIDDNLKRQLDYLLDDMSQMREKLVEIPHNPKMGATHLPIRHSSRTEKRIREAMQRTKEELGRK